MQTTEAIDRNRFAPGHILLNKANIFLAFWFLLNLVQIAFTELTSDEGYYWFYATRLQWGYYDHPPMIALLIRMGSILFPGELGVRFFNLVLSTAAVKLFLDLLPARAKNSTTTFLLLLSAPLLSYLAFIVFPDGPLLFFSMLFLVWYRRFLKSENAANALLLGLAMALMLYSKYHGVLVIGFTILANLRLLLSKWFWLAAVSGTILFSPHLYWQYQHNFPSLQYHLSGRTGTVSMRHVLEFLSQQVGAIAPGLIIIPFVARPKDIFEKTLLYIIAGSFIFFTIASLKTFVHFHWTSIAVLPLLYFAVSFYHDPKRKKLFQFLIVPFVVILCLARIILLVDLNIKNVGEDYYHGRKLWAADIKKIAAGRPVFFPNNLREASLYSFYSGEQGVTLYERPEKKSQYEMWGYEDRLQGRPVLMVTKYPVAESTEVNTRMGQKIYCYPVKSFTSFYNNLPIAVSVMRQDKDTMLLRLIIQNQRTYTVSFEPSQAGAVQLVYFFQKGKDILENGVVRNMSAGDDLQPGQSKQIYLKLPLRSVKKPVNILFGFRHASIPDSYNSMPMAITNLSF